MAVQIDEDECIGCGSCASTCPRDAITVDEKAKVDAKKCVECLACVDACPVGAIKAPE